VAGASSASLAIDEVSDGAGEAEGIRCLVDVELAALVDRRGGIIQVSDECIGWWLKTVC
jgi:hypothetical protein